MLYAAKLFARVGIVLAFEESESMMPQTSAFVVPIIATSMFVVLWLATRKHMPVGSIVLSLALAAMVLPFVYGPLIRDFQRARARARGIPVLARIVKSETTGVLHNYEPELAVTLEVRVANGVLLTIKKTMMRAELPSVPAQVDATGKLWYYAQYDATSDAFSFVSPENKSIPNANQGMGSESEGALPEKDASIGASNTQESTR